MQLQLHCSNYTTARLQLHYTTTTTTAALRHTTSSSCGWGDQPGDHCNHCNHSHKTQLQPPFSPSVDSLCHPWFTTAKLSYRFPSLKLPPPPCAVLLVLKPLGTKLSDQSCCFGWYHSAAGSPRDLRLSSMWFWGFNLNENMCLFVGSVRPAKHKITYWLPEARCAFVSGSTERLEVSCLKNHQPTAWKCLCDTRDPRNPKSNGLFEKLKTAVLFKFQPNDWDCSGRSKANKWMQMDILNDSLKLNYKTIMWRHVATFIFWKKW